MQKKTKTVLSVLLAGTLLLGAVSAAAADSTTSASVSQSVKRLCQKFPGRSARGPAQIATQLSTQLKTLVEKGTITQAQADKVEAYFEKIAQTRQADFDQTKNMTREERQAYMQKNREKCQDPLAQLVTDKVLSQEQADAIAQLFPMHRGGGKAGDRPNPGANQIKMKEALNGLVTKGTLTQNQADTIMTSMEKNRTERQAAREKAQNLTQAQRQKYMQELKGNRTDHMAQLVADKVITSEQAETIKNVMPQPPMGRGSQNNGECRGCRF